MERWRLAEGSGGDIRLNNRTRSEIWISPNTSGFDLGLLFRQLEQVGFPLRFTNGIDLISFTILHTAYGWHQDGEVWVDVQRRRRRKTVLQTFVHEVAHYVDDVLELDCSVPLTRERRMRGALIHRRAAMSNEEYWARGFERFYSIDPEEKRELRRSHPRLYERIRELHERYRSKR